MMSNDPIYGFNSILTWVLFDFFERLTDIKKKLKTE